MVKIENKEHSRFIKKIARLLYKYGQNKTRQVKRDGFVAYHNETRFYVELDGIVLASIYHRGEQSWAARAALRKASKKIDAMFVLDDLADV